MSEPRRQRPAVAPTAIATPNGWLLVHVGGCAVALELVTRVLPSTAPLRTMGLARFTAASAVVLIGFAGLHLLAGWALGATLGRVRPRLAAAAWLLLAALFGYSWQRTIANNDGLTSLSWYPTLAVGLWLGAPLGVAGITWLLWLARRPGLLAKRTLACLLLAGGVAFSLFAMPDYRAFHGHLILFNAVLAVGLLRPVLDTRWGHRLAAAAMLLTLAAAAWMAGDARHLQRMLGEHSRFPAAVLRASPLDRWLRPPAYLTVTADQVMSPANAAELRGGVVMPPAPGHAPRGRNVLLVVLESTRWDMWGDPAITPRFAQWSGSGVTLPYAVMFYLVTPLAYGGMFTAQPAAVVSASPFWGRERLFDSLGTHFDAHILTRPRNHWFGQGAILRFFLPPDAEVHDHSNAVAALAWTKDRIADLKPGTSYFAWAHLYEPHKPYQRHRGFDFGAGRRNAYKSELAYVDDALGQFMRWFQARPDAAETLVLIVADHGQALGESIRGEPYWGHHVHVHNLLSRVPFFAAGPGLPRGRADDAAVGSLLDVLPTLYDFLGVELPADHLPQGRSLYALLADPAPRPLVTAAFSLRGQEFFDIVRSTATASPEETRKRFAALNAFGSYSPKVALEYGRDKIVFDRTTGEGWLYDIVDDPLQLHDLADSAPQRYATMTERLAIWVAAQGQVVRSLDAHFVDQPPVSATARHGAAAVPQPPVQAEPSPPLATPRIHHPTPPRPPILDANQGVRR